MNEPKTKDKDLRNGFGKLKVIVLLGVLIYVGITFASQQSTMVRQLERREALAQQEAELQWKFDFLRNELNYIGTDDYVEQQARIRLGWLKPDEIKYVEDANGDIVQESVPVAPEAPDDESPVQAGQSESESAASESSEASEAGERIE